MGFFAIALYFVFTLVVFNRWMNNSIGTFHQAEVSNLTGLILGAFGTIVGPVGATHKIYL